MPKIRNFLAEIVQPLSKTPSLRGKNKEKPVSIMDLTEKKNIKLPTNFYLSSNNFLPFSTRALLHHILFQSYYPIGKRGRNGPYEAFGTHPKPGNMMNNS